MATKIIGIDLGTTNSCIAMMTASGPKVVPVEPDRVTLPSAVFYGARGDLRVGSRARTAMMTSSSSEGEGFDRYKLHNLRLSSPAYR